MFFAPDLNVDHLSLSSSYVHIVKTSVMLSDLLQEQVEAACTCAFFQQRD